MPNRQTIEVQSFTAIRTAKSGNKYFTLTTPQQETFVCFIPTLRDHCHIGTIDADVELAKTAGDNPHLENIYENDKPVYQAEKKAIGRSYSKSKEELAQLKQLDEAKRRSIEAQVSLIQAVALAVANKISIEGAVGSKVFLEGITKTAREFYQLLQSLSQISEAKVIHQAIKEAKSDKEPSQPEVRPEEIIGEEREGTGQATNADLARLKEAMEIHGQDKKSIIVIARALQFPEDSRKLTIGQVNKLIKTIEP